MGLMRILRPASDQTCEHARTDMARPRGDACEECGSSRSLRMCAVCGHVGCCDSQAGDARRHFDQTGHEVMVSMPTAEGFSWCYVDDRYVG